MSISVAFAFIAGLLSFFSPCVFALIPAFLAYLAGVNLHTLDPKEGFNKHIFFNTLFYVLGFTLVFTVLGLLLNSAVAVASIQARAWLTKIGALIIIFFGVYLLGFIHIPFLEVDHKFTIKRKASYTTSFLFGVAFAVGWTPCIGAVLGSIFTLAATQPGGATPLLAAYSLGLALPFLLVGVFYSAASKYIRLSASYTRAVSIVLGVLLIIIGLLLFSNRLGLLSVDTVFARYI